MSTTVELCRVKAELAALRAAVEGLADRWEARAEDYVRPVSSILLSHAEAIRNLLDADA